MQISEFLEQKRKYELIHKASVKSQYYKTLNNDAETGDDTPDYVKEVRSRSVSSKISQIV